MENKGRFKKGSAAARDAGMKGGRLSGGNFKNNRERAVEAGRKGGQQRKGCDADVAAAAEAQS